MRNDLRLQGRRGRTDAVDRLAVVRHDGDGCCGIRGKPQPRTASPSPSRERAGVRGQEPAFVAVPQGSGSSSSDRDRAARVGKGMPRMFVVRRSADRGHFQHGWLDTYHTFSFGEYQDPQWMQFGPLRVMNDDRIAPGQGFGMHGHRDMEILTWVLDGELAHRDSLGHEQVLRPGELQRMSAGTGIRHSEFNPSQTTPTHLYQIWLLPDRAGHTPRYEQRAFPQAERQGRWQLLASPDAREGSLGIHTDATVSVAELSSGQSLTAALSPARRGWLQLLRGRVIVGDYELVAGDGIGVLEQTLLTVKAAGPSEVLWFDLE